MDNDTTTLLCRRCGNALLTRRGDMVIFKGSLPPIFYGDNLAFAGRCKHCGQGYRFQYQRSEPLFADSLLTRLDRLAVGLLR